MFSSARAREVRLERHSRRQGLEHPAAGRRAHRQRWCGSTTTASPRRQLHGSRTPAGSTGLSIWALPIPRGWQRSTKPAFSFSKASCSIPSNAGVHGRARHPLRAVDAAEIRHRYPALDPARLGPACRVEDEHFWEEPTGEVGGFVQPESGFVNDAALAAHNLRTRLNNKEQPSAGVLRSVGVLRERRE